MDIVIEKIGLIVTKSSLNKIEGIVDDEEMQRSLFIDSILGTPISVPDFSGDWKIASFTKMKRFALVTIERVAQ